MKPLAVLLLVTASIPLSAQIPPLPDGQIKVFISPSSNVAIGQNVTVTCRMDGYRGTTEIDSVNFDVRYDTNRFVFVNGSFSTGTTSGPDQQWLSKANQDTASGEYALTNASDGSVPGVVSITLGDEGANEVERGSLAASGFLISFQLQAIGSGATTLLLSPAPDGSVLLDTSLQPVGTISLGSPSLFVAIPISIAIQAADPHGSEPGIDAPAFLFTRTGPTNAPVVVHVGVSGTARPGYDYLHFPSTYTIPAGISNSLAVLTIFDDTEPEGDETVTLTLQASGDYDIAGTGQATVTIHDDENLPPAVTLTGPVDGTVFPQPTNVILTATASDSNGSVTNVGFYREGTVKLGEDTTAPYSFTWSNAPPGNYVLTARATDNLGATADSVPVSVMVRGAPGVDITAPTNNASFSALAGITVSANAADPDGTIAFLELYRNGEVFAATNGGVISQIWTNAVPGSYTLKARAGDDRGLVTTSAPVAITVTASGIADHYTNRPFLTGYTNYTTGNSSGFTEETGEPQHLGRPGDHSGWVAWTAPASGTVTIDTLGSSFDTVLVIYTNSPPGTDSVSNLVQVAGNDNADSFTVQSKVSFTVVAGRAYVIAVDAYAAGFGGTIHIHISLPDGRPVISVPPQSQLALVDNPVTFNVTASGSGTLTYQWRRYGTNLPGATATNFTLASAQLGDAGPYDVKVSNSSGSVTSVVAVLVVLAPAAFTSSPTLQVVDPGGTASFSAAATGSEPLFWQWNFHGLPLPGQVTSNYTRYNAQHADGGVYSVTVENAAGYATAGAELIVRPVFTALTPSNGTLHLNWHGTTGKVYVVEGTTNLNPPSTSWITLGTVTNTVLQGQFQISLTNPPSRNLRLRVGP